MYFILFNQCIIVVNNISANTAPKNKPMHYMSVGSSWLVKVAVDTKVISNLFHFKGTSFSLEDYLFYTQNNSGRD